MQQAHDYAPWRANFVEALGLLARAAARLPFGVPDPVLSGTSAVELYSGGLWSAAVLEVLAEDAARLTAELFAAGFRWTNRPQHLGRGLWHSELLIGIDIIDRSLARARRALQHADGGRRSRNPWVGGQGTGVAEGHRHRGRDSGASQGLAHGPDAGRGVWAVASGAGGAWPGRCRRWVSRRVSAAPPCSGDRRGGCNRLVVAGRSLGPGPGAACDDPDLHAGGRHGLA